MNSTIIRTTLLSCAIALTAAAPLSAKQYNQPEHLSSQFQVKVNKVIAQGQRLRGENGGSLTNGDRIGTCGNLNINSIDTPLPGQPPIRDQITVVTGDVINVVTNGCR